MANPIKVIEGFIEAQDKLADFILNGPDEGVGGFVRDFYRDRCDDYANLPTWATALNPVGQASFGRFCKPYWDDRGFDGPVGNPPLVSGGQCPGRNYDVQIRTRNIDGSETAGTFRSGDVGPISISSEIIPRSCEGAPEGYTNQPEYIYSRNGIPTLAFGNYCGLSDPLISVVATPTDGLPDECGDQEPDSPLRPGPNPPPSPGPLPGPEPTDNPDPTDPTPFIPIPPFDDPVYGPLPITGPEGGGGGGQPAPPAGGDGLPGDSEAVAPPAGEVSGDDAGEEIDFGDPPVGRVWVGCIVEITVDLRIGGIPGTRPPSKVWPSVRGNLALKYSSLFGTNVRINSSFTEVFRPNTSLTVTGCFLQVQPGGVGTVFPISALTCPSNPCEETNG